MNKTIKGLLEVWEHGRDMILHFLTELSDDDLDKELPRKELNTIRLQIDEVARIQTDYINAITTKKFNFDMEPIADTSKQGLTAKLKELDKQLKTALEGYDDNLQIDWFGDEMSIYMHLAALIGHEQMHIGQIVAFCYATGIPVPNVVTENMGLEG